VRLVEIDKGVEGVVVAVGDSFDVEARRVDAGAGFGFRLNANFGFATVEALRVSIDFSRRFSWISYCFWSYVGIEPVASARALVALASNTESSFIMLGDGDERAFVASTLESRSNWNI